MVHEDVKGRKKRAAVILKRENKKPIRVHPVRGRDERPSGRRENAAVGGLKIVCLCDLEKDRRVISLTRRSVTRDDQLKVQWMRLYKSVVVAVITGRRVASVDTNSFPQWMISDHLLLL